MTARRWSPVWGAALVVAQIGLAWGQAARTLGPGAPPLAEQRYQLGVQLYASGDFDKAAEEFRNANSIFPGSSRLAYNLARTLERLDRLEDAVTWYQTYLKLAPQAEDAVAVERLINGLQARMDAASPEVILISRPAGGRVFVDGASEPLPALTPTRIRLKAGAHLLEFRLPGRDSAARSVTLKAGQTSTVEVTLPAPLEPGPGVESAAQVSPASDAGPTRWPAYALLGAGGLAAAGGLVLHLISSGTADEADGLGPSPTDDGKRADLRDSYDTQLLGARVGYAVGGAAVLGGVLWLLLDDGSNTVAPTQNGVGAGWRF